MAHTEKVKESDFAAAYPREEILVVKRAELFKESEAWHGLKPFDERFLTNLTFHKEYRMRHEMEIDEEYKQIIPYFIFLHEKKLFLMQRGSKGNEKRLSGKFTLGIGGHVRKEDVDGKDIIEWGMREFSEEVKYKGTFSVKPFGMINDDTNPVGKVHLGVVYLIEGDSSAIAIAEELSWGELISFSECLRYYERMEGWSQLVFDALRSLYPDA